MSDAPRQPDAARDDDAPPEAASPRPGGFVLDLSSSDGTPSTEPASWKRKRKQASPILTKIVDLTAPPSPKAPAPVEAKAPPAPRSEKKAKKPRPSRGGGATLADLLDPETLARLRGEDG